VLPQQLNVIQTIATRTSDSVAAVELCAHAILASSGTTSYPDFVEKLSPIINEKSLSVPQSNWRSELRILRLAALTSQRLDLLNYWIRLCDRVPREGWGEIMHLLRTAFSQDRREKVLDEIQHSFDTGQTQRAWNLIDEVWQGEKPRIMERLESNELTPDCWRLLVSANNDWVGPLGNALSRELQTKNGNRLLAELDYRGYWDISSRSKQRRERDGVGIVQEAADGGRVLALAEVIAKSSRVYRRTPSGPYPQDVFDLARALLRWHELVQRQPLPPASYNS